MTHFFIQIYLGILRLSRRLIGFDFVLKSLLIYAHVDVLRQFGAQVGDNVKVYSPLIIHNAETEFSNLSIGNDVHIGRAVLIDLCGGVSIEDRATVSMRCSIITHFNVGSSCLKAQRPASTLPVRIENDVYLGADTTVLQGVTIGQKSLVGACSLVTKDLPSDSVAFGIPAKFR